jgi:hypothetical protein
VRSPQIQSLIFGWVHEHANIVGANGGSPNAESIASINPVGWVANKEGERRSPLREMVRAIAPNSIIDFGKFD